ncbi:MAG: ATP/GTP-binding protein [Archaeoglobaceae archaeon]|nr:ATP/GTP-binding protein [Archaeoglobaceae archaeon]
MKILVIGPAGSGKSTFVREFGSFLRSRGYDSRLVNLDPASKPIYNADLDIRKFVKTEKIMKKYSLGINGALLKSVEEMLKFAHHFNISADFVLYDTPGQMELFIYSENGREFVRRFSDKFTVGIFILDSMMVRSPENLISGILQNVVVSLRLSVPLLTVISKCDVFDIDIKGLIHQIRYQEGLLSEIMEKISPVIDYSTLKYRTIKISNFKKTGFEELLSGLREIFCSCGDLS